MPAPLKYESWSKLARDKAGPAVGAMMRKAEGQKTWRHEMAARGASVYSSMGCGQLFDGLHSDLWHTKSTKPSKRPPSKLKLNFAKAIIRTLRSKITGLDEPKSQMVGTDCTWEERRQGVWADRFIEGTQHLPQGVYQDAWDLGRHGFLVSGASTGTVFARVEPDFVSKRVRSQLRSSMCTFIDPSDWADGRPLTYMDITWENPEYLAEDPRWDKSAADWIMRSAEPAPHMRLRNDVDFGTPMVKVCSIWRMPFGSFKGREGRIVNGKALYWEDWKFNEPPLATFRIQRPLGDDFWSENFIEDCYDALFTANDILRSVDEAIRKLSQTFVVRDVRGIPTKGALLNAKDVNYLDYDGSKTTNPLSVIQPPPINDSYWNVFRELVGGLHEILGVDQMHTSSSRPEGAYSGKAVRLIASLFSERFSEIQRAWRHWLAVDTAQLYLRAARQVGEREPDWQVTWPGQDFEAKVPVKALDIDDKLYTMRPYVVSEQKNTPADRAAAAEEMYNRGELTEEQLQVVLGGLLDTPKETKGSTVQRRWVAKNISLMLDSEESVVEDEAAFMGETYMQPTLWLDEVSAKQQVLIAYVQADIDDLPQNRRRLLRRFLEDLDMIEQQKAMQASKQSALSNANVQIEAGMDAFGGAPAPEGGLNGGEAIEGVPGGAPVPGAEALAGLGGDSAAAVGLA